MRISNVIAIFFYISLFFNAVANIIPVDDNNMLKQVHDIAIVIDGTTRMIFDLLFNYNMCTVNRQFAKFFHELDDPSYP